MGGDREALLEVLIRHEVAFVLIGGAAIQSYGQSYDTLDIDVVPDATQENLERLSAALNELECRLVTEPAEPTAWVTLPPDYFTPRSLRAATLWNLATQHGQLDLTFAPSGFPGGYGDLAPQAAARPVPGTSTTVMVAALGDVRESKRQANRPKDREYLREHENDDE
jgi:hypothetical protein